MAKIRNGVIIEDSSFETFRLLNNGGTCILVFEYDDATIRIHLSEKDMDAFLYALLRTMPYRTLSKILKEVQIVRSKNEPI